MIIPFLVVVAILSVPLTGGRLRELAEIRIRWFPALFAALAIQVLIIEIVPHWPELLLTVAHLGTYVLAGAFALVNLHIPGLWLIALGGLSNLLVIGANGGVMPASETAQRIAGRSTDAAVFENSAVLDSPRLLFLGDIFAIPEAWPLSNVFSIGDVLLVVGVFVALHRICHTRLAPEREPLFTVEV